MKRLVLAAFLSGLLGLGCMENHLMPGTSAPAPKTPSRPVAPPVTPDQVTPSNTLEIAKRLQEELDNATPPQGMPPDRKDSK